MSGGLSEHRILDGTVSHDGSQRDFALYAVGLDKPAIAEPVDVRCTHSRASRVCHSV